jgi:DNA helicase-2/ATP-dependent DNA helicase PcrA
MTIRAVTMDLSHLNAAQKQAVLAKDGPLLVLAGAGTGKTSVITHRMAHMVRERYIAPERILAVTFTNKAAREMRERAAHLTGVPPRQLEMGTFHSLCGRLLRRYGQSLGLDPSFVIYDADDQLQLIKRCLKEKQLDPQVYAPRAVRGKIEAWKNAGLLPHEAQAPGHDLVAQRSLDIYRLYQQRCLQDNAVDFGDLLLQALVLLRSNEQVRQQMQRRWTHLLVDEYQDTNPVQYKWLQMLVTPAHSLTVVGDDDQSIYRWRGADIGNILRFERDFPGADVIRLEQNYRSTQTILNAANAVIGHNVARKGKTLFSAGAHGEPLAWNLFDTERDEGDAVARRINQLRDANVAPADVAILYRTNAQSRPLEDALRRGRIPYVIYGGVRFYDRREVKDALAYLRLLLNPRATLDFLRVINVPTRGIGKTTVDRIGAVAQERDISLFEAAEAASAPGGILTGRAKTNVDAFVGLVHRCRQILNKKAPLGEVLGSVLQYSGYILALKSENTEEAQERLQNLQELVAALEEYSDLNEDASLAGFLEEVALSSDVDNLGLGGGQVVMMTLHAAKGLEFPVVFLPGLEEGLFPHSRSIDDRAALEEERRLCYVGLTRAKRRLFLSAARIRSIFGQPQISEVSRFVGEIPEELFDRAEAPRLMQFDDTDADFLPTSTLASAFRPSSTPREPRMPQALGRSATQPASNLGDDGYPAGTRVLHATFGEGRVVSSDGLGARQKLTVAFPRVGRKVIVARFVERL